jgi:glucuronosyltransferase
MITIGKFDKAFSSHSQNPFHKMLSVILILTILQYSYGANILFLNPVASPSHNIFNFALAEALALKGHNVTYASVDLPENAPPNFHSILIEKAYDVYKE